MSDQAILTLGMRSKSSRIRQRLAEAAQRHLEQVELLLANKGPLIRGSYGLRRRVCGKPGCHCVRGERHESKYLSASQDGRLRQVHVPESDVEEVSQGVTRYRRFREAEAKLVELGTLQLRLVGELGEAQLEPYPPGNPLPPRARRGRRPKP
jgi:hypothetical protein